MKPSSLNMFIGINHAEFDKVFATYDSPMKRRVIFCWVVLLSVLAFVVLINTVELLKPAQETTYSWFERSGALIGACAVFIEFKLKLIDDLLIDASMTFKPNGYKKLLKYDTCKKYLHLMALTFGMLGTLIWSYGSPFLIFISKLI